jgi:hypothetical protein
VEFETDAVNDYFNRTDSPGSITIEPPNLIEHSHLWNGRFTVQLRVPWEAKPGDRVDVKVTVEDIQTQTRSAPFVSRLTLLAEPEADPPKKPNGNGKPTRGRPGSSVSGPTLAIPEVKEKHYNDPTPSLDVRYDDQGQHEYFLNLDNAYLVTELTRAKEDDKPLVKYWFKYGLLLCAMGMLKEQQDRAEAKKDSGDDDGNEDAPADQVDDLKQVSLSCNGIARVIIPIVRTLYHGPLAITG